MTIHQAAASPGCGCGDRQDMFHSLISSDEARARIAAHATRVGRATAVSLDSAVVAGIDANRHTVGE